LLMQLPAQQTTPEPAHPPSHPPLLEPAPLEDPLLDPPELPPLLDVLPAPELLPPDDEEVPSSAVPSVDASVPVLTVAPPHAAAIAPMATARMPKPSLVMPNLLPSPSRQGEGQRAIRQNPALCGVPLRARTGRGDRDRSVGERRTSKAGRAEKDFTEPLLAARTCVPSKRTGTADQTGALGEVREPRDGGSVRDPRAERDLHRSHLRHHRQPRAEPCGRQLHHGLRVERGRDECLFDFAPGHRQGLRGRLFGALPIEPHHRHW
jgi:hypothetical protein